MRALLIAICLVTTARAGTITGVIRAEGKTIPGDNGNGGKYDSRKFKFAERVNYAELRDFVVYLEGPIGGKPQPSKEVLQVDVQKVDQRDAQFSPHVLPVVVGSTVEWPNHDEIYHNAFSMSDAKQFDLGLYKDKAKQLTFDKPGRIDVFCSIHSGMHCVVLVLENPYFVKTGQGVYTIPNVPAGRHQIRVWHERMPAQTRTIDVPASGEVRADFTVGISGLPQY